MMKINRIFFQCSKFYLSPSMVRAGICCFLLGRGGRNSNTLYHLFIKNALKQNLLLLIVNGTYMICLAFFHTHINQLRLELSNSRLQNVSHSFIFNKSFHPANCLIMPLASIVFLIDHTLIYPENENIVLQPNFQILSVNIHWSIYIRFDLKQIYCVSSTNGS